ncbi:MAG: hypothetical protein HC852_02035 [Acaryochloridaceae cyanobacterium RU_4_10]|nr:hypothetical protein [Acaryochloridaceae cyanobacterium RU_4_10]
MGINNTLDKLLTPEDSLSLCEGFFADKGIDRSIITTKNVLDAAEILIEIGHERETPYKSQCDILETALIMGWYPENWDAAYIKVSSFDARFDNGEDVSLWLNIKQTVRGFLK